MRNLEFLDKNRLDALLIFLNHKLSVKGSPVINLYIVGNAAMVLRSVYFEHIYTVDATWDGGDVVKECINEIAKSFKMENTWCNQKFKVTKSYTDAIYSNSSIYTGTGMNLRNLVVHTVNLDLLLAMKLIQLKEEDTQIKKEIIVLVHKLKNLGVPVSKDYIHSLMLKYYGTTDKLSSYAKNFIGVQ